MKKPLTRSELIQISGIVVTVLVFLGTIVHSNKKDKALQKQIDYLETIASQNTLLTKKIDEQSQRRKLEIKPKLSISLIRYDGQHVFGKLINNGGKAELIKILPRKDNNMEIKVPFKEIGRGKSREFYFKPQNKENPVINFKIIFKDIEGTRDTTEFQRRGRDDVFVRKPTTIKG